MKNLDLTAVFCIGHQSSNSTERKVSSAKTSRFALGAHLVVSRGLYTHHGIYVGSGGVIHYSGLSDGLNAGPVVHDYLESFAPDGGISVRKYANPRFSGKEIVERAHSRLGENKYDIHSNNCEDFCSWAVTGESRSEQVELVEGLLGVVSPVSAAALRLRKHANREKAGGASSDVAATAATVAMMAVAPVTVPYVVAGKLIKWILK